ncbi:Uncharacterised protein [Serratia fonticola]|uniref:DoxX n=1 Tax=Serratia fonticola TaxID=47917 RepID=A0A4U9VG75_SERFO|nr:Uncharacterised protein [Serratia fonticola]
MSWIVQNLGKLILRLAFSIMMIFHGWHKLIGGIDYIQELLTQHGLPGFYRLRRFRR